MTRVIINENYINLFEDVVDNKIDEEITFHQFESNLKSLLKDMLKDPANFKLGEFWRNHKFSKTKLVEYLIKNNIVKEDNKFDDSTQNYIVSYNVPKYEFTKKARKMYIKFFEKNVPSKEENTIEEDGAGAALGGATSTGSVGTDGRNHIDVPLFGEPIKKDIYKPKE